MNDFRFEPDLFNHRAEAIAALAEAGYEWLAMWFCGLSCVTSTSRMIFAFSRDDGMPFSRFWKQVNRRYRTPAAAVWLGSALAFLLPWVILATVAARPGQLDFAKLYPAVTGISTIGLYLSYGIPLLLKLRAMHLGIWREKANGPWSLGNWTVPVNLVALVWIVFITVLFVLPPNELTGYVFGAIFVTLLVLYAARVRGRFKGPIAQATSTEELLKLESTFQNQK